MDGGEQNIYNKLSERFKGKQLQVQDVSGGRIVCSDECVRAR